MPRLGTQIAIYISMITKSNLLQKTKEIMIKLNEQLFDNKLNFNFTVKLSSSGKAMGSVFCKGVGFNHNRFWFVSDLRISKYFNFTEVKLKSTIAHELIHVYEVQILKKKPSHDRLFKAKMNEINSRFPYLKVTLKHNCKSTKPLKIQNTKTVSFLLSEDKSKIVFITNTLANRLHTLSNVSQVFGKYTLGKISSDKIQGFSVARRLRYSYKITPEKLLSLGI